MVHAMIDYRSRITLLILSAALLVFDGCATPPEAEPARAEVRDERVARVRPSALPNVAIITTGGTIAMSPDAAAGGAVPTLSGEALVAAVPELKEIAQLRVMPLVNIDSRDMTPEIWLRLARLVREVLADPVVVGVVVTHGTDTMEDSAFLLDLVVGGDKPVVLTGAQRDATARDADGPRNLLNAVRQVIDGGARGRGVTVMLNGRILPARAVTKCHTGSVDAFTAGAYGQLGEIDDEGVVWFNRPRRSRVFALPDELPRVDLVYCYPGADGSLIDAAVASGARGVVVAGYGIGNVNLPLFKAIERARAKRVAVVLSTRVPEGRVYPVYGGEGGGSSMRELGVVFAGDLLPWKARIVLMLALSVTNDPGQLQAYFEQ